MAITAMPVEAIRLVRRYYTYAGIYTLAASIIWGINTLFLLDAGLSIAEVFIANAAFSVGTVLFEIPTGVVADTIGRRASFLLSLVVLAASTLAYVGLAQVGSGVVAFSAVSIFIGLGYTFYSGAMEAWLVDGVRELGFDGDMDRVFARGQVVGGVAMLVGTVGGGFLGQIDLALPFLLRSALLAALLVLAFFGMHDIGFQPRAVTMRTLPTEASAVATAGIRHGWQSRPLRLIMIAGAVQNGFFFWAWYAWQPYFLELLERDAVWVAGVVAALLSLAMIAGNALVGLFTKACGRRTTILLWTGAVFGGASIGVGIAGSFVIALGFLLIASVAMGVQMPVRQAFIHGMVPSEERATVVSFDSMISGIGAVGGQAGLGVYAERSSYSAAYVVGGVVTLLAAPVVWMARRLNAPPDFFEGAESHEPGACVPKGLPAIAHVETSTDPG
ncbi:MAG: MFS transporter [Actinomycetota bacterium]